MTNEQKTEEICKKHIFDSNHFDCCMEMAQWKDEQFVEQKQQWIERAVIFLNERVCTEMSIPEIHNMIVDFRKQMEEQL